MSWLSSFFNPKNAADSAQGYLGQIPGATKPYYQPFIDRGEKTAKELEDQYNNLTNNTGDVYNKLGQGYKESPGYQAKLKAGLTAGQNASASGGMLGTPQDVQQQEQIGHDIADQDYENYMKQVLGLYGLGTEGKQKTEEQGFNASTNYGDILGTTLGKQGEYGYAGTAGKNAQTANNWSNLFKGIAALTGFLK